MDMLPSLIRLKMPGPGLRAWRRRLGGNGKRTIRGEPVLVREGLDMLNESRITSFFISKLFEFLSKTIRLLAKLFGSFFYYRRQSSNERARASRKTHQGSQ
ncbi:MAG: hypothetical protein QM686_20350 [Herbaspirillum sp.]